MIIVKLKRGMGNQMFQYALGRRLVEDLKSPLKLDISGFERQSQIDTKREYELHHFNILEDFANSEEIIKARDRWGFLSRLYQAINTKIFREQHVGYDPRLLNKKGDIYLDGFWHSEKYFQSIREIILRELALKTSLSSVGMAAAAEIEKATAEGKASVSLHVRRGDYVTNLKAKKYHGLITTEYYGGAIEILRNKVGEMKIFLFSDDIEWVKRNIPLQDAHYFVTNPSIPFYEEVHLMSLCDHNIIANSSFSWWGAWLNQNLNKIVIAPRKWLAKTGNDYYNEIPESWLKI